MVPVLLDIHQSSPVPHLYFFCKVKYLKSVSGAEKEHKKSQNRMIIYYPLSGLVFLSHQVKACWV